MRTVVFGRPWQKRNEMQLRNHNIKIYKIDNKTMTDPNQYGPDLHPIHPKELRSIRVVRSYTDEQEGQDIREEDVARPKNHCWCYDGNEPDENGRTWRDKSRAWRPTYGSCIFCYDAGPVGQNCVKCSINGKNAGYWMIVRGQDPKKFLDSIRLAEIFGGKTIIAKAGHCYFCLLYTSDAADE